MILVQIEYSRAVELFHHSRTANQYIMNDDGIWRIIIDTGGAIPVYTEAPALDAQPFVDFPAAIEIDDIIFTEETKQNVTE